MTQRNERSIFYASWLDAMEDWPEKVKKEAIYAIFLYGITGEDTSDKLSPFAKTLLRAAMPLMDAWQFHYTKGKEGAKYGGVRTKGKGEGVTPAPNPNPKGEGTTPATDPKIKNKNIKDENIEVEEKGGNTKGGKVADAPARPRFQKPSIEEVKKYVKNMGYYGFDVEHFYSYYESNGWKVGKNPMKDWTAAVRSWRSRDKAVSQDYISRTQLPDPSVYENIESTI